jgi:hypothetical protein
VAFFFIEDFLRGRYSSYVSWAWEGEEGETAAVMVEIEMEM